MSSPNKITTYLLNLNAKYSLDISGEDMQGIEINGHLYENRSLENSNFQNVNLEGADIAFINFDGSNFSNTRLKNCKFMSCHLENVNFENADLSNVDFALCDFNNSNFTKANLTGADVCSAEFINANLKDAILQKADCSSTNFTNANLQNANLTGADLSSAELSDSDLSGANLTNANLKYANLTNAKLNGADLTGIKICETDTDIAEIIGEENFRKAVIIPYFPPIHRSINFIFESDKYVEYILNEEREKTSNPIFSNTSTTIKVITKVVHYGVFYCVEINTKNEHILSFAEKVNIPEKTLYVKRENETKITLQSIDVDENGNSIPNFGITIFLAEFCSSVLKCEFHLRDFGDEYDIELLNSDLEKYL